MPAISVIVPVYNTKKYLSACFESISLQTMTDFEVIIVDDGPTDGSGLFCDEYAETDNRFSVFHKENGGVSSARNFALGKASGDHFCFIDSDDTVSGDYLEILLKNARDTDAVISVCRFNSGSVFNDRRLELLTVCDKLSELAPRMTRRERDAVVILIYPKVRR